MDPKAKARLERDMTNLRKQMKDLGKQLEKECGMKDFDPLKNMNPKYPFNILPDKNKDNPFGPGFPFNQSGNNGAPNNPFGDGFPFNQSGNPFGQNNPFFENLFKNAQAYTFDPPPGFMEDPFAFAQNGDFGFNPNQYQQFNPNSRPSPHQQHPQRPQHSHQQQHPRQQQRPHQQHRDNYMPYSSNKGPIIEEIDSSED